MSADATGWVWKNSPFSGSKLLVHLAMADVANDTHANELWMTRNSLAEKARVTRSTVDRALAELIEDGLLDVIENGRGRGHSTRYRLLLESASSGGLSGRTPSEPRHLVDVSASSCVETASPAQFTPITNPKELKRTEVNFDTPACRVFSTWVEATGRDQARTKFTTERKRKVDKALKVYELDDVLDAVRGVTRSRFHMGDNPRGRRFDDLELVLRDAAKIEEFRDLWRNERPVPIHDSAMRAIAEDRAMRGAV